MDLYLQLERRNVNPYLQTLPTVRVGFRSNRNEDLFFLWLSVVYVLLSVQFSASYELVLFMF